MSDFNATMTQVSTVANQVTTAVAGLSGVVSSIYQAFGGKPAQPTYPQVPVYSAPTMVPDYTRLSQAVTTSVAPIVGAQPVVGVQPVVGSVLPGTTATPIAATSSTSGFSSILKSIFDGIAAFFKKLFGG